MGYAMWMSLASLRRNWKLNLVLVISLTLGMLLPMLCLGNINVFLQKYATIRLKDASQVLTASFQTGYVTPNEVEDALEQFDVTCDRFALSASVRCPVTYDDTTNQLYVYYVTENWQMFETVQLVEGELDFPSGQQLCLVDESMTERYDGLTVGTTISISGNSYTVAGIFSALDHKSMMIPLSEDEWDAASGLTVTELYLHGKDGLPEQDRVSKALQALGLTAVTLQSGEQDAQRTLRTSLRQVVIILAVGLAAFFYAAINIEVVFTGKLTQDKREIGIHMALGASPGSILLSVLTEHLLCYGAAYLAAMGLLQLLRPTYPEELKLVMDAGMYAVSFLFGAIMVAVITVRSVRWFQRQKLVTLIERAS